MLALLFYLELLYQKFNNDRLSDVGKFDRVGQEVYQYLLVPSLVSEDVVEVLGVFVELRVQFNAFQV